MRRLRSWLRSCFNRLSPPLTTPLRREWSECLSAATAFGGAHRVRFRPNLPARIKPRPMLRVRCHRQIPLAHSNSHHAPGRLWCWSRDGHLQTHEQVELLAQLVVPQLGCAEGRAMLDEG